MYNAHFGLEQLPFTLTPDTALFFNRGAHHEALNVVLVALRSGEGFIKVTGEVGTGKTLLCRQLLNELGDTFATAYIPNPFVNPNGLRASLAEELGLDVPRNLGQHHLLRAINERLLALNEQGRSVVLIIDEAQSMPDATLEALRLLTNLETEQRKLLQLVIFGQPELDARLSQPGLRQLKQRIGFSYRLQPLDRATLDDYVAFRLQAAGYRGEPVFDGPALETLHRGSAGIPRLVNILAHKALMAAYGEGRRRVRRHHVRAAIDDTESAYPPPRWYRPLGWAAASLGVLALAGGAWWWLGRIGWSLA